MLSQGRDLRDAVSSPGGSVCVRRSRTALDWMRHGTLSERRQLQILFDARETAVPAPHFRPASERVADLMGLSADHSSDQVTMSMEPVASSTSGTPAASAWSGRVALHSTPFAACAEEVAKLQVALGELTRASGLLQLPPLEHREWYETLSRKLIPQLSAEPFIVVAVVGGTNIGKSVIFNHLAGSRVSATSPLASGTKHPVCLVPPGFTAKHNLSDVFQGFELEEWTQSDLALKSDEADKLYWKESPSVPANLLILDTPDVDSDAAVNWHRADCIRHCADVLVAVLTQQKYNDAAVKQFFRKAGAEDKAVVVVFNQVLLPEDEGFWPLWLGTFTRETGIDPEMVYVAPNDRRAAEQNQLPFYPRTWPRTNVAVADAASVGSDAGSVPHDLREDLSKLHFPAIKFRTLRGSLRQLVDPVQGIPAYLNELQARSSEFRSAAELLTSRQLARISNWPTIPNRLLVNEIRQWWRGQRQGWTKSVHDFYNTIGDGLLWSVRWATQRVTGPEAAPILQYQKAEHEVILTAIENLFDGLYQLSELGNDLLRPRITRLLTGERRSELLQRIHEAHNQLHLETELQQVVATQMQAFRTDSPQMFEFLKQLDSLAAAARPVTSVALFFAGGGPLGDAVAPLAHDAAIQAVLHIAGGTGAVIAGETALSSTSSGMRAVEAHFRQLHAAFTTHRLEWLGMQLKDNLLGTLQEELEQAAQIPQSEAFFSVRRIVESLRIQIS